MCDQFQPRLVDLRGTPGATARYDLRPPDPYRDLQQRRVPGPVQHPRTTEPTRFCLFFCVGLVTPTCVASLAGRAAIWAGSAGGWPQSQCAWLGLRVTSIGRYPSHTRAGVVRHSAPCRAQWP